MQLPIHNFSSLYSNDPGNPAYMYLLASAFSIIILFKSDSSSIEAIKPISTSGEVESSSSTSLLSTMTKYFTNHTFP